MERKIQVIYLRVDVDKGVQNYIMKIAEIEIYICKEKHAVANLVVVENVFLDMKVFNHKNKEILTFYSN